MLKIVPADGGLRNQALTLLYCRLPRGERERQLAEMLGAVDRRELSFDDLLVALDNGEPVGAILAVRRPGRMAFLWPPVLHPRINDQTIADDLLRAIAARLDAESMLFTQCLLDPADEAGRELLNRAGFPFNTRILLLSRPIATHADEAPATRLRTACYAPSRHAEFADVVERSYVATLDCPELARRRDGDEALASHRAAGEFDPALWVIGYENDAAVGVLLGADHRSRRVREIVYLGVVPEARGRGYGRALIENSLRTAQAASIERVEVAVDAANHFALAVYQQLDFVEEQRFNVHVRFRD